MRARNFEIWVFAFGLLFVVLSAFLFDPNKPRSRPAFLPPPRLEHITFGAREQWADVFWVRAIQDFDYCERRDAQNNCKKNGWLFQILDLVTDLAPKFRMPYITGGLALTVVISDIDGATRIFRKGVEQFPRDWPILSRAAYHALYEEKDKLKAAELLKRAAAAGGPVWYNSLAVRLYGDESEVGLAEGLLLELESQPAPDEKLLEVLRDKIKKLRAQAPKNEAH